MRASMQPADAASSSRLAPSPRSVRFSRTASIEERVGLLVDREAAERDTKRLTTRLKFAALRQNACVEDLDWRTPRGIDRAVFARLIGGDWIDRNENLLVTGATEPAS